MEIITFQKLDYKDFHLTGYFRDGIRRVDLVIVSQDNVKPEVEAMKINFLINALRSGVQFEMESGVKPKHKHLLFIKVHLPYHLIRHFGYLYNIRKYFKTGHIQHIHSQVKGEKELVKLVRNSYPGPINYSTMDRSMIAYRVLRLIPFDEPPNFRGVQRAVERGIFLDVYPLHDGPHFLVQGQPVFQLNGRQALFYSWIGYSNLFRWQPIHLIREYLGERVGFLFMFYQYIMIFILIVGLPGIPMFWLNFVGFEKRYFAKPAEGALLALIMYLIWRRKESYMHWLWEINEREDYYAVRTDFNPYTRPKPAPPDTEEKKKMEAAKKRDEEMEKEEKEKKEEELSQWQKMKEKMERERKAACIALLNLSQGDMEEHKRMDELQVQKAEEKIKVEEAKKEAKKNKKVKQVYKKQPLARCWKIKEFFINLTLISMLFLLVLPALITFQYTLANKLRYLEEAISKESFFKNDVDNVSLFFENIVHECTNTINGILVVLFEMAWKKLAHWMTYMCNIYEEKLHERNIVTKLFGGTFLINFAYIFFIIYFKGLCYTYPFDDNRHKLPFHLGMMNCGLQGCINEAFLVAFITYKTKMLFKEFLDIINKRHFKHDVPKEGDENLDVPCWEREYELIPFTDKDVTNKFNEIFIQLCFASFFIWIFPVAPLCVFLISVWKIRYWARVILLHSRRPLITHTWGLGAWRRLLWLIPYAVTFLNVYAYAKHTMLSRRLFDNKFFHSIESGKYFSTNYGTFPASKPSGGKDHSFWNIPESDTTTPRTKALTEYLKVKKNFEGPVGTILFPPRWIYNLKDQVYQPDTAMWYISWRQAQITFFFGLAVVSMGLMLHYTIEPTTNELREILEVEKSCRNYQIRREMIQHKSS